ncbi:MAG: alkaline phosphatase family protein, partial [Polyangiales bacterium]
TLGTSVPLGDQIPIDHFVLLMQENRSFDHYFGTMPGVEGFPETYSNPNANGDPVKPFHETQLCIEDVAHSWSASHLQYDGGKNDGFVLTNDPNGERSLGYFDGSDIPFYWDLYSTFAMSDHHHCSMLGGTYPNRWYYLSATSFGMITNNFIPEDRFDQAPFVIMQELDDAGVDWHLYYETVPFLITYPTYFGVARDHISNNTDQFFADLDAGTLAPVVWIDPAFSGTIMDENDEHPPAIPQVGEAWVENIIRSVMASEIWPRTAIILTYDEHGGFFDHVPPPSACPPDDRAPDLSDGDELGDYDRLGFRVPLVVISPYSKPGYVSKETTDATSILRLLEARYDLPALTARDANAWPLLDMFDFNNPAFMEPPELASSVLPPEGVIQACEALFPFPP